MRFVKLWNSLTQIIIIIDPPWLGGVRDSTVTRKTNELVSKEQYKFREASVSETENKVMSHFTHISSFPRLVLRVALS